MICVMRSGLSIVRDVVFPGCDPELCCRTGGVRSSPCHPNSLWCGVWGVQGACACVEVVRAWSHTFHCLLTFCASFFHWAGSKLVSQTD